MASTALPLEARKSPYYNSSKGDIENISVLDSKFCQDVYFPNYQPPPKVPPEMDPLVWQHWIETLTTLKNNLNWLLKLQYQKFWCQILNNSAIHSFLDSYLKYAPRFQISSWPEDVTDIHDDLHRLVFLTCIRLATNKESPSDFMAPEYFGDLIYENYIFDIPKLMDICVLYGNETNSMLLCKAIKNVFKCQSRYNDDLQRSAGTTVQMFRNIDHKCGISYKDETLVQRNSEKLKTMSLTELEDVVTYTSDICFTIRRFLVDVYPDACFCFFESLEYFVEFYSATLDKLLKTIQQKHFDDLYLRSHLLAHLRVSRMSVLSIVRRILNQSLLEPALQASQVGHEDKVEQYSNDYLNLLSEMMGSSIFFQDFIKKMPIVDDVKSLIKIGPCIDETRALFMLQSLGGDVKSQPKAISSNSNGDDSKPKIRSKQSEHKEHQKAENSSIDPEMASLISMVHDVLPHLEEDVILSCLLHFERDFEKTIHALLEGNVPDTTKSEKAHHKNVQESVTVAETKASAEEFSLLKSRKNICDNDEFDIYGNENVDLSRIHKGKKNKDKLDDFKVTSDSKHIYEKYSLVSDEEEVTTGTGLVAIDAYEDEYDDAYDGLGIGANDADDAYDILKRRPFVTPRVFLQKRKEGSEDTSDTSEDEKEREAASSRDHFIANPAEIRAKNEAKRLQLQEQRNASRKTNRDQARQSNNANSATNTAQQRKHKDSNKAKVANHNRKRMATKKASKGMGPV